MVNLSDYGSWLNQAASKGAEIWGKAQKVNSNYSLPGLAWRGITRNSDTPFASMMQREVVDKSDLRGAQLLEGMSNVPVVGNFIRGIQGVNRLEDLYNNTGRTAYYAGSGISGAGALGSGARDIAKIADGVHDLYQFYTGTPDDFRTMTNNMYG